MDEKQICKIADRLRRQLMEEVCCVSHAQSVATILLAKLSADLHPHNPPAAADSIECCAKDIAYDIRTGSVNLTLTNRAH